MTRIDEEKTPEPADTGPARRRLVALLLEVEVAEAGGRVERRRLLAAQVPRRVQGRLLRLLEAADEREQPQP